MDGSAADYDALSDFNVMILTGVLIMHGLGVALSNDKFLLFSNLDDPYTKNLSLRSFYSITLDMTNLPMPLPLIRVRYLPLS
jgi:hypothetical protein